MLKDREKGGRTDIRDVAKTAGVSIATVSRVLSGTTSVAAKSREKVLQAVAELGYRANESGRALRMKHSEAVALLISNIQNSFYAAIAQQIERRLAAIGYVTLLCNTDEDGAVQDRHLEAIVSRNVAGILVLCAVDSPRIRPILAAENAILINRRLDGLAGVPFIGIDDFMAARELAAVIARSGAKRIAIVSGPQYSRTSSDRLRGLCEGLGDANLAPPSGATIEASLTMESGYHAAARLLQGGQRFDAIFCGSDQIAYGVHRRCRELSLNVPSDVRLYGFDDNPLNQWLAPWLNTVRVPFESYARETVAMLQSIWAGKAASDIIVPYEIVIRP